MYAIFLNIIVDFLLLNFYLLTLENDFPYFLKESTELCTGSEIIDTLEECKRASIKMGKSFDGTEFDEGYPKGCYENTEAGAYTYWNNHISGAKHSYSHPICKKGEKMEYITSNVPTVY